MNAPGVLPDVLPADPRNGSHPSPADADAGAPAALSAHALGLRLAGRVAVADLTLELRGGTWAALVGPNGAGKSTLLQLLAGLRRPDSGEVRLAGRRLEDWPARERSQRLAWLAQQGDAEGQIAAREVVSLGRLPRQGLFGVADAADAAAVEQAMQETETTRLAERRLDSLSGGERQRVLLARALAVGAPVLLLDEPSTHLDPPHQRALWRGLSARARQGAAVLAVLHDLNLALAADRVIVMDRGRLVADGAPADVGLRAALVAVFDGALSIEAVAGPDPGAPRWAALPRL